MTTIQCRYTKHRSRTEQAEGKADMTAETTAAKITKAAEYVIARADKERKELAEMMAADFFHVDSHSLTPVLRTQAYAMPWRHVRARIQTGLTAEDALRNVRAELTRQLLSMSERQNADALVNETDRMEREASREFLRDTERLAE